MYVLRRATHQEGDPLIEYAPSEKKKRGAGEQMSVEQEPDNCAYYYYYYYYSFIELAMQSEVEYGSGDHRLVLELSVTKSQIKDAQQWPDSYSLQ